MQGGSLYHFYDGLWYDPAERRTHDPVLPEAETQQSDRHMLRGPVQNTVRVFAFAWDLFNWMVGSSQLNTRCSRSCRSFFVISSSTSKYPDIVSGFLIDSLCLHRKLRHQRVLGPLSPKTCESFFKSNAQANHITCARSTGNRRSCMKPMQFTIVFLFYCQCTWSANQPSSATLWCTLSEKSLLYDCTASFMSSGSYFLFRSHLTYLKVYHLGSPLG